MSLESAVKKTIDYAAGFNSHINKKEIKQRLISKNIFSDEEINILINNLGWKTKKNKNYRPKIKKATKLAKEIEANFRDVLLVGVSGSVSSGHPKKNDDIDILIITKANKLWKNRFKIRWWIWKNQIPHRKWSKPEEMNQFCFNLWLDETSLHLKRNKQNLKNAVDLILLKPLVNKKNTYEGFLLSNSWARKWVATPYENKIFNFQNPIFNKNQKENNLDKFINYLYFWPQYWYMKGKIKSEKIGLHQAFFHRPMVK